MATELELSIPMMEQMNLITPDIFDYFMMSVLAWYAETSNDTEEDELPNVFKVFEGGSLYSQMFVEQFIEGFARQHAKHNELPGPGSLEFTEKDQMDYVGSFMSNYNSMQPLMIRDFCMILDHFQLVYVWDDADVGGDQLLLKNNPIKGVW